MTTYMIQSLLNKEGRRSSVAFQYSISSFPLFFLMMTTIAGCLGKGNLCHSDGDCDACETCTNGACRERKDQSRCGPTPDLSRDNALSTEEEETPINDADGRGTQSTVKGQTDTDRDEDEDQGFPTDESDENESTDTGSSLVESDTEKDDDTAGSALNESQDVSTDTTTRDETNIIGIENDPVTDDQEVRSDTQSLSEDTEIAGVATDSDYTESLETESEGDLPEQSDVQNINGMLPSISAVSISENEVAEIAEGHTETLFIQGANLQGVDAVVVDGTIDCVLEETPSEEHIRCTLEVPHGASQGAVDDQSRFVHIALQVVDELHYDDGSNLKFSPICAATDGDDNGAGTISHPYKTLTQALKAAAENDTILVMDGIYSDGEMFPLKIGEGVTVRGIGNVLALCPSSSLDLVRSSLGGTGEQPTVLQNLMLAGGYNGWIIGGGKVEFSNVALSGVGNYGIRAESTTHLKLDDVTFFGFGEPFGDWSPGGVICATNGSTLEGHNIEITDPYPKGWGVVGLGTSELYFDNLTISEREMDANTELAFSTGGIYLDHQTTCTVENSKISYVTEGVAMYRESNLYATNVVISDNRGDGIRADNNAEGLGVVELNEVSIVNNDLSGLNLWRKGLTVNHSNISHNVYSGIIIQNSPDVERLSPPTPMYARFSHVTIEGNHWVGLLVNDAETVVVLDDVSFIDNISELHSRPTERGQVLMTETFQGTLYAAATDFQFKTTVYKPTPQIVEGPMFYLDPEVEKPHFKIDAEGAYIEFLEDLTESTLSLENE